MHLLLSTLALFLVLASPAAASTYEVGPGKPYANLQAVAPLLDPGDVVLVQGGCHLPGRRGPGPARDAPLRRSSCTASR